MLFVVGVSPGCSYTVLYCTVFCTVLYLVVLIHERHGEETHPGQDDKGHHVEPGTDEIGLLMILETKICFLIPGANVGETPETEYELDGVKDAFEEEESPELHDGGVEDVHQEARHVRNLLGRDVDVQVGDALQGIAPGLGLRKYGH